MNKEEDEYFDECDFETIDEIIDGELRIRFELIMIGNILSNHYEIRGYQAVLWEPEEEIDQKRVIKEVTRIILEEHEIPFEINEDIYEFLESIIDMPVPRPEFPRYIKDMGYNILDPRDVFSSHYNGPIYNYLEAELKDILWHYIAKKKQELP